MKIFKGIILLYLIIEFYYFFKIPIGAGDESLFINDLSLIKSEGWLYAVKKGISIPYMLLALPLSFIFKNYLALRITNFLLLLILFLYFKKLTKLSLSFYYYLLFFISTVGYFYIGTNDTLFFIGLIIFINEVNQLQEYKIWNSSLAFIGLIISFFTRELIIVYSPVILFCFYIIYVNKGLILKKMVYPIILFLLLFSLNIPSLLEKGEISYDSKQPLSTSNSNWVQRQYLAQLLVNKGELPNFQHPSWDQTDTYLKLNGKKSLPKTLIEGLFFDIKLTLKEFFKDLFHSLFYGFRQLGLILIIPIVIFFKYIYIKRKIDASQLIPLSLITMLSIFSLIIISYVELRWLAPIFILSIVYYSNLQKRRKINYSTINANYFILCILSLYGIYRIITKIWI